MNKIQTRIQPAGNLRLFAESREIRGIAILFNQQTLIGDLFYETILPDAVNDLLYQDVRCLLNNDKNLIVGRTKSKTLVLKKTNIGLEYYATLPNSTTGNALLENIKLGNITNSAASYIVEKDSWSKLPNGSSLRTILKIKQLFSVGPFTWGTEQNTTVGKSKSMSDLISRARHLKILSLKLHS